MQPFTETPQSSASALPIPSRRQLAALLVLVFVSGGLTVGAAEPTVADQPTPPLSLELDYEVTGGPAPDVGVPSANASTTPQATPTPGPEGSPDASDRRTRSTTPRTTKTASAPTATPPPTSKPSEESTPTSGTPTDPTTPTDSTPTTPTDPTPTTPPTPTVVTTSAPPLTFGGVVPGDGGHVSLTLDLTAPATLTVYPLATDFTEGGLTEPERNAGDHTAEGELQHYLGVTLWVDDDGDGRRGFGEQVVYSGPAAGLAAPDGGVAFDGGRCLPAGQYRLGVQWSLPTDTPNVAQTDSLSLDVGVEAAGC